MIPRELFKEASDLARRAFSPEKTTDAVLVWDAILGQGDPGEARSLVYKLEGWDEKRGGWIANDTVNPGELFQLGDLADACDVKCFSYFLLGSRGAIHQGETIEDDKERFSRFELAGGEFSKWGYLGISPKGQPARSENRSRVSLGLLGYDRRWCHSGI